MNKIAVITGATAGIGKACAEKFAANQYNLIITGRRNDRLSALQTDLEKRYHIAVLPLCLDVQDKQAVDTAFGNLPENWQSIDVLINNAGLALGRDSFEDADMADWETMLNTNVHGLLYVSRALLPYMLRAKKGHIINLGSIAGKEVYEKGNVYCASKFAVDAITKSMRVDLLKHNIKVTGIHPGAVETEFSLVRFKGDEKTAGSVYNGLTPLKAEDIADTIWYCASLPAHVCINDLVITCTQQAGTYYFHKNQ
ncbi:MAG TPA: SDR family NAD(P)-dependent oxidoreductase [Ferruginibacter sp.]|nr:SDR family NAD(P)-dependent oxidoreductase [Ferruginibacter sp.]HMX78707.1 SDR family NAD(P)-dependent oxidoreductase [Ferruginibacter sp.]HNA00040.1 SDR family NAD(P)-dependent oxidoreductase [Ferruginibacter sp.]HNG62444.1 SDR family NAD(P)-dependent oxidoreductase [Ferruginibacter sp.]HNJ93724.1 SDR family NAD(P)-dependent oxidoreductase [Ferruginibacter sp.]